MPTYVTKDEEQNDATDAHNKAGSIRTAVELPPLMVASEGSIIRKKQIESRGDISLVVVST